MSDRISELTAKWTKERVEKMLKHISGTQNSEVIPETIKIMGGGHKLDFAIRNRDNGEESVIHCNIDDNSCSDPYLLKPREYKNTIPSEK
ncbi:MAG: hypothetical protein PHY14_05215 [Candidatus Gracilibacteria bacterium]|nr:hypothetical protein [Candidatus Gracilibacteria bacterium]